MIDFESLVGKKIFVILKSKHHYTGEVKGIDGDLIHIIDKFDEDVMLNRDNIDVLKVIED